MKDITQYQEDKKYYAVYYHKETVDTIKIDVEQYTSNSLIISTLIKTIRYVDP
jgi:hypothetical protein